MHATGWLTRFGRLARPMAVMAVQAGLLVACGPAGDTQVRAAGPGPPPAVPGPVSVFQGQIASVDVDAAEIVVSVRIVWAPVLEAIAEERLVVVGPRTRWQPAEGRLDMLQVGEEVQVKAEGARGPLACRGGAADRRRLTKEWGSLAHR